MRVKVLLLNCYLFLCSKNYMKIITQISASNSYSVRHPILRPGKPFESCRFEGDELPTTTHFGLFNTKKLIGVVSVFKNNNSTFNIDNQFQIRGMAVLTEFQKKGFGKDLMNHCAEFIKSQNGTLIWFNAREIAVPFYEKLGYIKSGNPYTIADIGLHYVMQKEIG